ncbi:MAG: hypothetical protein ACRDP3_02935 [Streptomyces sp.]|uniref:hypothetical protein n=1 Tax=Streptomyces sp. TaxID=1931 RepID=UPI003D6B347C
MLRHVIAPARFFSQVPNEIIRHPRLSSDAVRLLTWQLSLPEGAHEPLSRTAERAGIKKTAFQNAKRQLSDEGFLHEWRAQNTHGHWTTTQLVSNVPLTVAQAMALREGRDRSTRQPRQARPAEPPTAARPTAGQPTGRSADPQPQEETQEKNSHPPTAPGEAERLLLSLREDDPRLAMSARTARRWAPLAEPWLTLGLPREQVVRTLTQGLTDARSPLGALHWRLQHALPTPSPLTTPTAPPPRVARMRECEGSHLQPRLFLPSADETRCPDCSGTTHSPTINSSPPPASYLAARAAVTSRFRAAPRKGAPAGRA